MSSVVNAPAALAARPAVLARILVVDDEEGILSFVSRSLRNEGYTVDLAADAGAGLEAATRNGYDLIILDLLLPGMSGMDLLRELIARNPNQCVIVLSALTDTQSKVASLELGAEDYLAKPFSFEELLARVHARLRENRTHPMRLSAGRFSLDLLRREGKGEHGQVQLAEREFLLFRELMAAAGTTVTKEHLLAAVWGYHFDPGSNVVDVYVRRLRAKLGSAVIKTVRGEGYRVDAG
jgi:DNA-binding response OmpR family regulator